MATLINVCGASFSGTTMLDLMLGNADDAFSCGEVSAWFRPWRTHHFEARCSCRSDDCPWPHLQTLRQDQFHVEVARRLRRNFVIDSSKELCWVADSIDWALRSKMSVVNVVVWKAPRDLAYSFWKRGAKEKVWRHHFVRYHRRFLSLQRPFVAIFLGDLIADPPSTLGALCRHAGMTYFPRKEHFWTRNHHHLFGNRGTRQQTEQGTSSLSLSTTFDPRFAGQLRALDQELARDQEIQSIISTLRTNDIRRSGCLSKPQQSPARPLWYYATRGQGLVRRFWPQKSLPSWR